MNLDACRIIRSNCETLHFTSVEETLICLEEYRDIIRVEIDAIDLKSTVYSYIFENIDESIESLMNL